MAEWLLQEVGVALVSGVPYGVEVQCDKNIYLGKHIIKIRNNEYPLLTNDSELHSFFHAKGFPYSVTQVNLIVCIIIFCSEPFTNMTIRGVIMSITIYI